MIIKLLEVKEDISWSVLKKYVSLLTLKRQEKCERYIKEHDKCISLLSELLIFMELGKGKYKYVDFSYNQYGKPYIANNSNIFFSISHSKDCIVYIEDTEEIGIDIEYMKGFNPKVIERFFTPEEKEFIKNSKDINNDGYMLWTRKEAILKRNGTGFYNGGFKLNIVDKEIEQYMYTEKIDQYMISVCASKPIEKIDICKIGVEDILNSTIVTKNYNK